MKYTAFLQGGPQNTVECLELVKSAALERGISHVVVASTSGKTGMEAARILKDVGLHLTVVTHNTGFREPGEQEMSPQTKKALEGEGVIVYTGTMVLRGLGTAIKELQGYSQQDLVSNTLRMLGQGIKVCVEMAAMLADAGVVPIQDIIAVAGTRQGADTAVVVYPQPSNRFFHMKVREILAKPKDW